MHYNIKFYDGTDCEVSEIIAKKIINFLKSFKVENDFKSEKVGICSTSEDTVFMYNRGKTVFMVNTKDIKYIQTIDNQ